jgi:hypothetical protein
MKDTVLTARRKTTELLTLLACFVLANLLHVYAIIVYRAPFSEVITSIFYVLLATVAIYVLWTLLRLLCYGIRLLITRKKNRL